MQHEVSQRGRRAHRWLDHVCPNTFHRKCPLLASSAQGNLPANVIQNSVRMANDEHRPVVLVVLDGWGYRKERDGNAIRMAHVPTWDRLWARAPGTLLDASGLAVGLPEGQMGNSEVGHLNLGAGRVVMQDIVRIDLAVRDGSFFQIDAFKAGCAHVRRTGGTLHLMGLIGDGGVHAVDRHLFALFDLAERERVPQVSVHALLDARDTLPKSALGYLQQTVARARGRAIVASLGGRY